MMLSLWMYLLFCSTVIVCHNDKYTDFINVTSRIHKETCGLSSDITGDAGVFENRCCGNCYNYTECEDLEKCCLSRFLSSRTNCVLPQFLTSEETTNYPSSQDVESYWMETSCPKETIEFFPMDGLQDLCENPGNYNFLEAHLPVSDAVTAVHYRNVFCAYCLNISPMQLKIWQLEVHCHKRLYTSDLDILDKTKNEKCNIFYKPPNLFSEIVCTYPQYTIYQCNQSGLWRNKDELIEWACNNYYDPFNGTYQNVFCYICNVEDSLQPNNWYCPMPNVATKSAPNIAKFEVGTWRRTLYKKPICDPMTQFRDYKMGVCRLIHCDSDKVLSENMATLQVNNFCRQRNDIRPNFCQSFFVRLTVISVRSNITSSLLKDSISLIKETILLNITPVRIAKVELFAKPELNSNDPQVDYFVVKVLVGPDELKDAYLSILLNSLHRKILIFYLKDKDVFFSEIDFYDEIIDSTGEVYIEPQSQSGHSWDKLIFIDNEEYGSMKTCIGRPVIQLHKTNVRPYLKLIINEIPMEFIDGVLILIGEYLKISLSKFDYKVQNDTVYICFEDYLLFYNAEPGLNTQNSGQSSQNSAMLYHSHLLVVLLIMCCLFGRLFLSSSETHQP